MDFLGGDQYDWEGLPLGINREYNEKFDGLVSFGEQNNRFLDKLCAFLLAISPILQHYKGIFTEAGIFVMIILFPYIFLKLLAKLYRGKIAFIFPIAPLFLYYTYRVINHGVSTMEIFQALAMLFYFSAASSGCINIKHFVRVATFIAVMTSVVLIVQYFCYYLLGFHLHLTPTNLLLEESARWVTRSQTGAGGSFYRPSAIFLEPSHIFIYVFPLITILLLAPNMNPWRLKMAALITLGLILSTSGMGIAFSIGIWILYFALYKNEENIAKIKTLLSPKNIALIIFILVFLTILYFAVDFFRLSIDRIFAPTTGRSAIQGRTSRAIALVNSLKGDEYWFGASVSLESIEYHVPGFHGTFYRHGLVGVIISYIFYVTSLFKLKAQYFWMSFVIIILSFFTANTHGAFYMLYYVIILMDGYNLEKNKKRMRRIKI